MMDLEHFELIDKMATLIEELVQKMRDITLSPEELTTISSDFIKTLQNIENKIHSLAVRLYCDMGKSK